jgi:hypothetical protein
LELELKWRVSTVLENSIAKGKRFAALLGMFLRRMLGTPSQFGAFPLFSFLIKFLYSLEDVVEDKSSLNALLLRTEQLSWTEVDNSDRWVLS